MSHILDKLRTYPATLNTQIEAMKTLQWWISQIKQDNYEREHFASRPHVITLYAALSRHIIRPNPYAAQDLNSQIQEHTAVTQAPRAIRTLYFGTLILERLEKPYHNYHTAIPILLRAFVQSHLISHGSRWMKRKAYVAWSRVQESLTMNLHDQRTPQNPKQAGYIAPKRNAASHCILDGGHNAD